MGKRITQKDIAEATGLSVQAVSMALRGHRRISQATRERVHKKAEELGYRIDPALQALVAYRSQSRSKRNCWQQIALVHDWRSPKIWQQHEFSMHFRELLLAQAADRGISIEETWVGYRSENAESAFRRLYTKGITGVLVAPHVIEQHDPDPIPVPRDRFQVVTSGPRNLYPDLVTVQSDYYWNLSKCWREIRKRGYRRIGLLLTPNQHERIDSFWYAAYLIEITKAGFSSGEFPILEVPFYDPNGPENTRIWLDQNRLDAVITSHQNVYHWLKPLRPEIFVATMGPQHEDQAGIDVNLREITRTMLDMLSVIMQQTLMNRADASRRVLVPGIWQSGNGQGIDSQK